MAPYCHKLSLDSMLGIVWFGHIYMWIIFAVRKIFSQFYVEQKKNGSHAPPQFSQASQVEHTAYNRNNWFKQWI